MYTSCSGLLTRILGLKPLHYNPVSFSLIYTINTTSVHKFTVYAPSIIYSEHRAIHVSSLSTNVQNRDDELHGERSRRAIATKTHRANVVVITKDTEDYMASCLELKPTVKAGLRFSSVHL